MQPAGQSPQITGTRFHALISASTRRRWSCGSEGWGEPQRREGRDPPTRLDAFRRRQQAAAFSWTSCIRAEFTGSSDSQKAALSVTQTLLSTCGLHKRVMIISKPNRSCRRSSSFLPHGCCRITSARLDFCNCEISSRLT